MWTNADNGAIRLATSSNGGKRWTTKTVGTTTASPDRGEGLAGYPTVGASGDNVTVSWFADDGGRQLAKSSSTRGTDLSAASPAETLTGSSPSDGFHYAVARGASDGVTNDVAIAYTTDGGIAARVFDGVLALGPETQVIAGSWPTQIRVAPTPARPGPSSQPFGAAHAAAFSACRDTAQLRLPFDQESGSDRGYCRPARPMVAAGPSLTGSAACEGSAAASTTRLGWS